jgi:hypothetical protein
MRTTAQAMVEFALAISVFMLLVLGTFDLARAYLAFTVVTNAARDASRYGAAHVGEPGWESEAARSGKELAVGIDGALLTLTATTTTPAPAVPPATQYIHVTGTYWFRSITPGVAALLGGDPSNGIKITVDTSAVAG